MSNNDLVAARVVHRWHNQKVMLNPSELRFIGDDLAVSRSQHAENGPLHG